jgi:hypothetical protein
LNEVLKVFGSKMILEIFLAIFSLIFVFCLYVKFVKWTYFEKLGVVQMPTSLPFGNFNELLTQVMFLIEIVMIDCTGIIIGIVQWLSLLST